MKTRLLKSAWARLGCVGVCVAVCLLVCVAASRWQQARAQQAAVPAATPAPSPRRGVTTTKLDFAGAEIKLLRDEFGVPHVFAPDARAAYFGGGYAVAQDRLFQLERLRRQARGQLAEIEGALAYNADREARLAGYNEAELQAQFDELPADLQQLFQAYADGINAFTRQAVQAGQLPAGFKQAGLTEPAPWRATDSAAIGILMAQRFSTHGGSETQNLRIWKWMQEKFGPTVGEQAFNDLFWLNDPQAPTSIPATEPAPWSSAAAPATKSARVSQVSVQPSSQNLSAAALDEASHTGQQEASYEYAAAHDLLMRWGSFACVVAPARSVSGHAMLLGGPQMGFTAPSLVHEIHYFAPGLNVIGIGIPGVPVVLIGHNNHVAWTATSGFTDMVDVFAEKLNPANKYQYMHRGAYRDMEKRVEIIKVKGFDNPRPLEIYRTVHGPVVAWDEAAGVAYTRSAAYARHELTDIVAAHHFNRARNIREFAAAAAGVYTNRNYLAATVDGDIGYWHCGRPPLKAPGVDPRLPTPGTGEYDWLGLRPFNQMPQIINPKQGFIANWNNKPSKDWNNGDQAEWSGIHEVARIETLLKGPDKISLDHLRDLARDISTFDPVGAALKPYVLAALEKTGAERRDARVRQAAAYLRAWDDHTRDDSIGTTLARTALVGLREKLFADDLDGFNQAFPNFRPDTAVQHFVQMGIVLRALQGKRAPLPLQRDYFNGQNRDEVILAAFNQALDLSTEVVGPQMNLWRWQQCELHYGPLPGVPRVNVATYLQIIELSQPQIRGENVLPPGQSENPRSPHFSDQRELAATWRLKEMLSQPAQFERPALRDRECAPRRTQRSDAVCP